jgi:hypothetical protein
MSGISGSNQYVNPEIRKLFNSGSIISELYTCVREAGELSSDMLLKKYKSYNSNTAVHLLNVKSMGRRYPRDQMYEERNTKKIRIEYNPDDIVLVGGAALKIYDMEIFSKLKHRSTINTLENFINKTTSDIDIVWWPRLINNLDQSKLVNISSPIISVFVNDFVEQLNTILSDTKIEKLSDTIHTNITNVTNITNRKNKTNKVSFSVIKTIFQPAGVYNIVINLNYGDSITNYKICEIAIHDTINGQEYDINYNRINTIEHMSYDPSYVTTNITSYNFDLLLSELNTRTTTATTEINQLLYLYLFKKIKIKIDGTDIFLPNIIQFYFQQLLAFNNFTEKHNNKIFVIYNRLFFILKMFAISDIVNSANIDVLNMLISGSQFKLNEKGIDIIYQYLYKSYDKMLKRHLIIYDNMCRAINTSNSSIGKKLCNTIEDYSKNIPMTYNTIIKVEPDLKSYTLKTRYDPIGTRYKLNSSKVKSIYTHAPPTTNIDTDATTGKITIINTRKNNK